MKKILITGSSGMLGSDLVRHLSKFKKYEIFGLGRVKSTLLPDKKQVLIDLAQPFSFKRLNLQPDVVIHTAAITDLSFCEKNPELAHTVHVDATRRLMEALEFGSKFIYISTDSVFDGDRGDYTEQDIPNPLNVYARTKLLGEKALLESGSKGVTVLRTNIYGFNKPFKNSLAEWAFQEWIKRKQISGFTDVFFNAVYTGQLAEIIEHLIHHNLFLPILNVGSSEAMSKYAFLKSLATRLKVSESFLKPALSSDFPTALPRPRNTSLNVKLLSTLLPLPTFEKGVSDWVEQAIERSGNNVQIG
jgi:dTDP-4-dehydrorhamnose reductase